MRTLIGLIYKIGYQIFKVYWFIRRPNTEGVRCIIRNGDDILLIKHSYGSYLWNVPGGGIKKGETREQAILREIKEEVGLEVEDLVSRDSVFNTTEYKNDTIHVFVATSHNRDVTVISPEIRESAWFPHKNLPPNTAPLLRRFLSLVDWS